MERFAYKNADVIITITEDMAENIRSKTEDKNKVHVVRNWIDTEKTVPVERSNNTLFDELGLSRDNFYVTYAGNIGMMQGVETIVDAAEKLQAEEDIQFIMVNVIGLGYIGLPTALMMASHALGAFRQEEDQNSERRITPISM